MKGRIIVLVACIGVWLDCVGAYPPEIIKAMSQDKSRVIGETKGAKAKEILRVIDQDGEPVKNARIYGSFWPGDNGRKYILIDGLTNANGEYFAEGVSKWKLTYQVTKDGYYMSNGAIDYLAATNVPVIVSGKWQPYGSVRTVVLKKIKNPGKIYVFPISLRSCRIPELGKWIGFDLEYADWTAPYGKGQNSDMLLKFFAQERNMHDYRYVMDVSFTNNPYAGAYLMKKDKSSKLDTTYIADTNATYRTSFSYVSEQAPGKRRHWEFLDADSYLVFRTRTRVDKDNNLIGAHYGKILGRWLSDIEFMVLSDGCFNPVENDVNIEDGTVLRTVLKNLNR